MICKILDTLLDLPEPENSKTGNHCSASESSTALLVYGLEGSEDVFGVGSRLAELSESMGINIEPNNRN